MNQVYYPPSPYGDIARPQFRQQNTPLVILIVFVIITLLTLSMYNMWNHPYAHGITFTPPTGGTNHRTDLCGRISAGTTMVAGDYVINHNGHLLLVTSSDITVLARDGVVLYSMVRDSTIFSGVVDVDISSITYTCAHVYNIDVVAPDTQIVANTIPKLREFETDSGALQTCMFTIKKPDICA